MGQAVSRQPVFDPRSVYVTFVLDEDATEQVFLHEDIFSPRSINQPLLHTHLHPTYILLLSESQRPMLGNLPKTMTMVFFRKRGKVNRQILLLV
jgi:hypothetical protein